MEVVSVSREFFADVEFTKEEMSSIEGVAEQVSNLMSKYRVLRVKTDGLTDDQFATISRKIGPGNLNFPRRWPEKLQSIYPEVNYLSNMTVDGEKIGALGGRALMWHQDACFFRIIPKATVLYGRIVPVGHGDTHFASLSQAYEALPDDLKKRLEGVRLYHDAGLNATGDRRPAGRRRGQGWAQPIVVPCQRTGAPTLLLGRRYGTHVVDMDPVESTMLLNEVWRVIESGDLTVTHKWREHDLVIWDNIAVTHGRDAIPDNQDRFILRVLVEGTTQLNHYQLAGAA